MVLIEKWKIPVRERLVPVLERNKRQCKVKDVSSFTIT